MAKDQPAEDETPVDTDQPDDGPVEAVLTEAEKRAKRIAWSPMDNLLG